MSDKYRVRFTDKEYPDAWVWHGKEYDTDEEAQAFCANIRKVWDEIYTFEVIPPDWTPPHIIAKEIPETRAGSPRGVESDLLGLP